MFLSRVVVVVKVSKVVGNVTFIHVKIVIWLVFSAEEDNKTETNDMSLCSFIKNEWQVVYLNPKN